MYSQQTTTSGTTISKRTRLIRIQAARNNGFQGMGHAGCKSRCKTISLFHKQVRKLIHAKLVQTICIGNHVQYPFVHLAKTYVVNRPVGRDSIRYSLLLVRCIIVVGDVSSELVNQERRALQAAAFVSDGIFNHNLVQHGAVVEFDQERIADGTHARFVVLDGEPLVFDTVDLGAQRIDTRISRRRVGVRLGRELAKDERVGDHVTDGMTSVIRRRIRSNLR